MPRNSNVWVPCNTMWVDNFEEQLRCLKKNKIKAISMPEAVSILLGKKVLNERMVCITFDDGFRNNLTVAWPAIKRYGLTAHFFITAEAIGRKDPYNWDLWIKGTEVRNDPNVVPDDTLPLSGEEIRFLSSEGATIGSHGLSHKDLTQLSDDELWREVYKSRERIQDLIGQKVDTFAYPLGNFNLKVIKTLQAAKYMWGFTVKVGRNRPDAGKHRYKIRRFSFTTNASLSLFKTIISGGYDFIRVKDFFFRHA